MFLDTIGGRGHGLDTTEFERIIGIVTRVTDRDVLRAAARDVRTMMRRAQAEASGRAGEWVPVDDRLIALATECDDVVYNLRAEAPDLTDRLAAVLGDDWEPS